MEILLIIIICLFLFFGIGLLGWGMKALGYVFDLVAQGFRPGLGCLIVGFLLLLILLSYI